MKKIFSIILLSLCLTVGTPYITEVAAETTQDVTVDNLSGYLDKNFGTIKTKIKNIDVSDDIRVFEADGTKCFDIAIVVDWSAVKNVNDKIQSSTKYTKAQKKAFAKALKSYQKKMAAAIIELFPNTKIRGGFLDYGYDDAYLIYHEYSVYGWKNYEYSDMGEFQWYDFDGESDVIGLY